MIEEWTGGQVCATAAPNIKICVSSRLRNVFSGAFDGTDYQIAVERLIGGNMEMYVSNGLAMRKISLQDSRPR